MDAAQQLILDHGYSGMSVDALIRSLGLTKGAFFHHFGSKVELARQLVERYAEGGVETFQQMLNRARKQTHDPLQQYLLLIGLYMEQFEGLEKPYEGCLLASYIYELQQFDEDMRPVINREFLHWREELSQLIREVIKHYPPRVEVNPVALADMFSSTFEGAFILSKSLDEPDITHQQLQLYQQFVRALFQQ